MRFFGMLAVVLATISVALSIPVVITYIEEGVVPRLPTAVLSLGIMLVAVMSVFAGLVLDTVSRGRREVKLLRYLAEPWLAR
jgi:hypothetical protein